MAIRCRCCCGRRRACAGSPVELREQGHEVHFTTVANCCARWGTACSPIARALEGAQHPDRDAQFRQINERVGAAIAAGEPAISIDTKKKELVGEFKNAGREWRPKGEPIKVYTHDFPSQALGKAIPYGVYDIASNEGFVNVGITAETAQLAVASIRALVAAARLRALPGARALQITADCGGGNGNRIRLWKTELQRLADDTGLTIRVCHFPPGTSKWNKIEHRLFCSHQPELARPAADQLPGHHQLDRRDHDQHRPEGLRQARRARLPQEDRGHRRRARRRQPRRPDRSTPSGTTRSRPPLIPQLIIYGDLRLFSLSTVFRDRLRPSAPLIGPSHKKRGLHGRRPAPSAHRSCKVGRRLPTC